MYFHELVDKSFTFGNVNDLDTGTEKIPEQGAVLTKMNLSETFLLFAYICRRLHFKRAACSLL